MRKLIFFLLFMSGVCAKSASALIAPEIYGVDPTCRQEMSYRQKDAGEFFGECLSCDSPKGILFDNAADCDLCPNRMIQDNRCRLKKCPADKPFYDLNYNWSGCKSCSDEPKNISKEECDTCPNMRWSGRIGRQEVCLPDRADVIYYSGTAKSDLEDTSLGILVGGTAPYATTCDRWDKHTAIETSASECARCPSTSWHDGYCYFSGKTNRER